jgi:hypothetical protein
MTCYVELDPKLNLNPKDFAQAWNSSTECQKIGKATLLEQPSASFDPSLTQAGMLLLEGVLMGVMGNLVYGLINELLLQQGVQKKVRFVQHTLPDGKQVLGVTEEEAG